jgi:hypothetical protein
MTIRIAKSNPNKKQSFLNSIERAISAIYRLGKEKESQIDLMTLRLAQKDPDLWYNRLVIEVDR